MDGGKQIVDASCYTMDVVIDSVKLGMKEIVGRLQDEELDVAVSIIEYNNINAMDSALAVKINGSLATDAEGNRELSFTKEPEEIESLIDQITPMGGYEREISGTPLAGLGYVTTLLFRNNASKFTLLITDKSYGGENCHGFNSVYDLLDCLKEKNVTLSISTMSIPNSGAISDMTVQNYKRWFNRIEGVFVLLRNFNSNIDTFNEFVLTNLIEEDTFTILKSNSLEKVTLAEPLVKGGATDTDGDGLTDSDNFPYMDKGYCH